LEEVGYAGFNAVQWYGVVGPAGIPPEIVRRLSETLATVLKAPDLRDKLSVEAVEPMLMSPEQFGRYITEDVARWSRLAQSRGIQLDG
jgi:tripartite-type tricarboxylate transporter receptor subunit TctC